ncbi:MAG TPA: sulfurtransferase [Saprospiraceae bacterium]|nr:sulfurtransferase [Saprospiraceae bacterium]
MLKIYNTLISVDELQQLSNNSEVRILDCTYYLNDFDKGRKEYLNAHIPGAYFMDIGHDLSSPVIQGVTGRHPLPDPEVFTYALRACGINEGSQVVAYDQMNGVYASRAWWLLNWLGHSRVAILNGGKAAWKESGLKTDNQWPPPKKGNLKAQVRNELTVNKEFVSTTQNAIVDSREYKRYTGETEPIDPVAGHIPGAICIPYMDNVDEKGFWKSKEFFFEKFSSLPADPSTAPVFYCGSGVTACHNIFAYKLATNRDAKLYGGSWSEWINYYPIEVGS